MPLMLLYSTWSVCYFIQRKNLQINDCVLQCSYEFKVQSHTIKLHHIKLISRFIFSGQEVCLLSLDLYLSR